jgi:acetolactate synthase-1/2/3 large subunit
LFFAGAQDLLRDSDLAIVIGSALSHVEFGYRRPTLPGRIVRLDLEPDHPPLECSQLALRGRAQTLVEALLAAVPSRAESGGHDRAAASRSAIQREALEQGALWQGLIELIAAALGEQGILVSDCTMAGWYGGIPWFEPRAPRRFLYPMDYAPLGFGLPAAIGAKLSEPERPVIALSGDGGFLFTVGELALAVEERLCLPIVVVNDGGYGEIRREMVAQGTPLLGVDLHTPDFAALARSFGARGVRIRRLAELSGLLREALAGDGPTLIEVPIETLEGV